MHICKQKVFTSTYKLGVCPLSNTHWFEVWVLQMQKTHKWISISKQQEAALEKQWGDRPWKSKKQTSSNFINYYENCVLFDLQIPFAAWEENCVFQVLTLLHKWRFLVHKSRTMCNSVQMDENLDLNVQTDNRKN